MAGGGGSGEKHPGMMGDGTEEQNLDQPGQPGARIGKDEVEDAFDGEAEGAKGEAGEDVSNEDKSDAGKQPKDNSHNFT